VPAVPRDGDGPGDAAAAQAAGADWRVATENARRAAKMRGSLPGSLDAVCNALVAPVIDWRDVLREFFRAIARDDYSWVRPNRRHVADGLYLPSCYSERLGRLVVVVDTSGSMTDTAVQRGFSEVAAILAERPMGVDLLLHDSKLYATHTIDIDAGDEFPQELKMRRGGTSHVPAFAWIAEHGEDVAAVLCLTDCESDLDSVIVPDCPVLFARPARCRSLPPAWAAGLLTLP
jgi:predicted metal-dependent peptidase